MRPFFEAMFLGKSARSQAVVERALRLRAEVGAALFPRMVRWDAERMEAALRAITWPVLAIQCTYVNTERKRVPLKAGETTPWLDLLGERLENLKVEILPGLGHFPQLEAAPQVNRLIGTFAAARR